MKFDLARYDVWDANGEFRRIHNWKQLPRELRDVVVVPCGLAPHSGVGFVVAAKRDRGAGRRGRSVDPAGVLGGLERAQRWAAIAAWSHSASSVSVGHTQQHESLRVATRLALDEAGVAGGGDAVDVALALLDSGMIEASMMPDVLADSVWDPAELYETRRRSALAVRLCVDGVLHTSLSEYPCAEVVRACPVGRIPDAVAVGGVGALFALVAFRDDVEAVDAIAASADPDALNETLAALSIDPWPSPATRMLLAHPDVTPDPSWSPEMLRFALSNPGIGSDAARVGLEALRCTPLPGDPFNDTRPTDVAGVRPAEVRAASRFAADALSSQSVSDREVVAVLSGEVHESVIAAVVSRRRSGTELTALALNSPRPTVRRAATVAALRDDDIDTQLRLARDHDVATRCRLAESAWNPFVLAALTDSPERCVRDILTARDAPYRAPTPSQPDTEHPGGWEPDKHLWARLEVTPSFGTATDDTWTGRALASRLEGTASKRCRNQAHRLASLRKRQASLGSVPVERRGPVHKAESDVLDSDPLWVLSGLGEFLNVRDEDLANATCAMSLLWKETGNVGSDGSPQRWLQDRARSVHNLAVSYQRPARGGDDNGWKEQQRVLDELAGELADSFLVAAHEEALERCRAVGVTHVPVSRGMSIPREEAEALGLKIHDAADVTSGTARFEHHRHTPPQAPLASWAMNGGGAGWGSARGGATRVQVVMRTMLPVQDIAGFGGAGFGGFVLPDGQELGLEAEVVVMGRDRPCEILAVTGEINIADYARKLMAPTTAPRDTTT